MNNPEISDLINEIINDRERGASELGRQALLVLKTAARQSRTNTTRDFLQEQQEIGRRLIAARPAMSPIRNAIHRLLETATAESGDIEALRRAAIARADDLISRSQQAVTGITENAGHLLKDGDTVLTHSYSSTVLAVIRAVFSSKRRIKLVVTRSGPGATGRAIVRQLAGSGIPITFIDDTAVGMYMPTVDKVLLGADTINTAGVINGVGSCQAAIIGAGHGVPVYVLAETLKIDTDSPGKAIDYEDRDPGELWETVNLPPDTIVRNPHFDLTPLKIVTAVVTEEGVHTPDEITTLCEGV